MRTILFNHIPRTGGTTLRIVLNRVYGQDKVFFIKSKDINASLEEFRNFSEEGRSRFKVISGHGAELFAPLVKDPFFITVLRDPTALFLSQYHYLKVSPNSSFIDDVSKMDTVEEYLGYALRNGQDNLLTRYISGDIGWLADRSSGIPQMDEVGEELLEKAKANLGNYDAVLDLATFDDGIYALSGLLGWEHVPLYRPSNRMKVREGFTGVSDDSVERLRNVLRFDRALYDHFRLKGLDAGYSSLKKGTGYYLFKGRQWMINTLTGIINPD